MNGISRFARAGFLFCTIATAVSLFATQYGKADAMLGLAHPPTQLNASFQALAAYIGPASAGAVTDVNGGTLTIESPAGNTIAALADNQVASKLIPPQFPNGGGARIVAAPCSSPCVLPLSRLNGPTKFHENIADGYFIYHDSSGYHLRVTSTKVSDRVDYQGKITALSGKFSHVRIWRTDRYDSCTLGGGVIYFSFVTNGYLDGCDWNLSSGGMRFSLNMNGSGAAPNISLGSHYPFGLVQDSRFSLKR